MSVGQIICCMIFLSLSASAFVISALQFLEKGYLLNNAYFWASPEAREQMDKNKESKRPYYRQSGAAFMLAGLLFLIEAVHIATGWIWTFAAFILAVIVTVVYAVVSSVRIERRQRK
ncbi:MAG: DUF3784 domain-containing protein [Oscillospiraceae bacterium]|nr:DUF3784 domain-containing protein [Oscillospiraceae bacterium]